MDSAITKAMKKEQRLSKNMLKYENRKKKKKELKKQNKDLKRKCTSVSVITVTIDFCGFLHLDDDALQRIVEELIISKKIIDNENLFKIHFTSCGKDILDRLSKHGFDWSTWNVVIHEDSFSRLFSDESIVIPHGMSLENLDDYKVYIVIAVAEELKKSQQTEGIPLDDKIFKEGNQSISKVLSHLAKLATIAKSVTTGATATAPPSTSSKPKKAKRYNTLMTKSKCNISVAIDLSFHELMNVKDIAKMGSQLTRCYSENRALENPLQLHYTSFGGKIEEKLIGDGGNFRKWDIFFHSEPFWEVFSDKRIVYLTHESENVLGSLDEDSVYIIGGLVDHNHHKGLCLNFAKEKGFAHARLPIDENITLDGRKVLSSNQVVEALQQFTVHKNWKVALMKIIPPRKMKSTNSEAAPSTH